MPKKKEKKGEKKKDKKRKRKQQEDEDTAKNKKEGEVIEDDAKPGKKDRNSRKKEKEELLAKVPKVDEHGISYTKLQIRRMTKRVKRGLPPVPTEEEERERLRNEAQLRREEEAELLGIIFKKEDDDDDDEKEEDDGEKDKKEDDKDPGEHQSDGGSDSDKDKKPKDRKDETKRSQSPSKKAKRSKPVPSDYVCQACKNKHHPPHWIYDCPDKVTVKGTNKTAKKFRGMNEPDSRKVFVSGLPFDVKPADVERLFHACGKVTSCRLVKFGDTGRCNGQAYVSFDTDDSAKKAIKLSGKNIDNSKDEPQKKQKKSETMKRKELKLKVSKVLNRKTTKRG